MAQGTSTEVRGEGGGGGQVGVTNKWAMSGKGDVASLVRETESHKILGIERRGRWEATDRDRGMRWESDNMMCEGSMRG